MTDLMTHNLINVIIRTTRLMQDQVVVVARQPQTTRAAGINLIGLLHNSATFLTKQSRFQGTGIGSSRASASRSA